jgi:hypothetical protein
MGTAIDTVAVAAAYQVGQVLGLVILVALVFWLIRRFKKRADEHYEKNAPMPPTISEIMAEVAVSNGGVHSPSNGVVPSPSNGVVPSPVAEVNGSDDADPEVAELEGELRRIYEKVGQTDAFDEANGKVTDLAADLVEQDGLDMGEALRTAYRRSLAEHHEYLAAKGLA